MKLQAIAFLASITIISVACGRPDPDDYRSQGTTGSATNQTTKKDTKTADATKTPTTNSMTPATANNTPVTPVATPTPTPAATPPAAAIPKAAKRTVPNATEIAAAKTLYAGTTNTTGCTGCHGAIAASAKKGATKARIDAAINIAPHAGLKGANLWPIDTVDDSDDGVDQAALKSAAMAEALK